jgi:hypothetical protein
MLISRRNNIYFILDIYYEKYILSSLINLIIYPVDMYNGTKS